MLIALGLLAGGLLVLALRQQLIKHHYIIEKEIAAKLLYMIGVGLAAIILPIGLYEITDTLWEWMGSLLLLAAIIGLELLAGRGIRRLKYNLWIIPVAGCICIAGADLLNKLIISGTTGIFTGVLAGLISLAVEQKEEELKHAKLILMEAIIICFLVVWGVNTAEVETKPARIIREQLTDMPESCTKIKIAQGEKNARRGRAGDFRVFLENEQGTLEELREYTYFKGNVELTSKQVFN